jgi:hypothetical protein
LPFIILITGGSPLQYSIEIKETLSRTVNQEAELPIEALDMVKQLYKDSKIILDSSDFSSVNFILNPSWLNNETSTLWDTLNKINNQCPVVQKMIATRYGSHIDDGLVHELTILYKLLEMFLNDLIIPLPR